MEIIIHRVNRIEQLKDLPHNFGAEIDLRAEINNSGERKIILNHEPYCSGDNFEDWIKHYKHGTLILNIKEAGIEKDVIDLVDKNQVKSYFLLDVEYPFIYRSLFDVTTGQKKEHPFKNIAIRYSEAESIEFIMRHKGLVQWAWIDTNTVLPLDSDIVQKLRYFKTCLVCPERWDRPNDIENYKMRIKELNFCVDAVMTSLEYSGEWLK